MVELPELLSPIFYQTEVYGRVIGHNSQCTDPNMSVSYQIASASVYSQQGYRPCEYPLPPGLPGPVILVPV
jgi:hypothetical protein